MNSRTMGAVLIMLGTFLAYMGIWIALIMDEFISEGEGGWLGPEPVMLIPIASLWVATFLFWLGGRLWRRREHRY